MNESKITLTIQLEIGVRRDGDEYVAWCIPLDVFSQGKSKSQAIASLREAIELWFESCLQRGVLNEALREVRFVQGVSPAGVKTSTVDLQEHRTSTPHRHGEFTPEYIEVSVPAYIAAHTTEPSAPC